MKPSNFRLVVFAGLAAILAAGVLRSPADPEPSDKTVPERIVPLSREQLLTKVPQFYCFVYRAEPQPGKRYWLRVNNDTWIERYPNGLQSRFKVLGHVNVQGTEGTLVVKVSGDEAKTGTDNVGNLQAFIPDKGSARMQHLFRRVSGPDTSWQNLGPMLDVE